MSGPEEFVRQARKLLGVRWRHQGRKPWAVDCIGLVAVAGKNAGLVGEDEKGYGRDPWDDRLRRGCRARWGEPIPIDQAAPGCIVIMRWGEGEPSHMGIVGDHPDGGLTIIHSHNLRGVVEVSMRDRFAKHVVEVYRPRFE